jgi:hypothetical protein
VPGSDAAREAFDSAYRLCLGKCFDVLVDNLVVRDPEAEAALSRCCALCTEAYRIALGLVPEATVKKKK